ncbi:MAG: PQQ-dependent sugar dehydrogenase [Balneolaceae bacterium]|nr:PQQ-dependent sugar dehydrogenase [Balneolaceae bacterium]
MNPIKFSIHIVIAALVTLFSMLPAAEAQDTEAGRQLYMNYCSSCHGSDLQGGTGSNLADGEWKYGATRADITKNIKNGIPGQAMVGFVEALSDDQIDDIVDFIKAVESGDVEPGPPMSEADTLQTLDYLMNVETFAQNLVIPWAIDFPNENIALITERPGRLRMVVRGKLLPEPVSGIPEVLHEGQGGMLDVTSDPNFSRNGWIYLAYSHALDTGGEDPPAMTRIVRGRINDNRWVDQEVLFEAPHNTYRTTRHHYGSQIVFDKKGYLYFSIGDRGGRSHAQDLSRPNGKIHRIHPDGSIPKDNPFVGRKGALPSIYSYGHRNPQGLAVHPGTDRVWDAEHGPRGGDELNLIIAGLNYGWPEISYGIHYDGRILTRDREKEGMQQPILYWRPSIAVSGIEYYSGDMFPYWKNRLMVGALAYEEVRLLNVQGNRVIHQQVILKDRGRVRDVVTGPDGAIYVVLNEPGRVLRLSMKKESLQ